MRALAFRIAQFALRFLLVLGSAQALSSDFIVERAMLEDRLGHLSVAQVAASTDFRPLEHLLVAGYTDSVWWLRLQVRSSDSGQALRLRIRPTFLDDVRLYEAGPDGGWRMRSTGDRSAFVSAERSLNALGFDITPEAKVTTYYLRLQTSSSAIMHVQALTRADAARKDALLVFFHVLYLAFMTGVLLWSGLAWWREREWVMGTFALYQSTSLFHALALTGYLSPFDMPPWVGWSDVFSSVFVLLTAGCGLLFHAVVLGMYAPRRVEWLGLWGLVALEFVLLVLYLFGHQRLALQANALLVLLAGALMLLLALTAQREGFPRLRVLRTVYLLQTLSIAASMLPLLGWTEAVEWSLQSSLIHGLISACLMVYTLDQRARSLREQAQGDHQRAVLAEQRLQIKAQEVAEQGRSIDVLTHELKTPISVAMMSLGATQNQDVHIERTRRAIGHLDAIVERTRLSVLADSRRLQAQLAPCNVSVLVYECIEDCRAPERVRAAVGFELEAITDAQLLGLIVTNLIDNALKYSPPNSVVDVRLEALHAPVGEGLRLVVINDEGAAGLPDSSLVFQKYYRSPGAQSRSGSGLGLFLSQHLAQLIGARLSHRPLIRRVEFELCLPWSAEDLP